MTNMTKRIAAFDIPGFHESVKRDFDAGLITLEEAALEFAEGNWTPYVNIDYTKRKLGLSECVKVQAKKQ